MGGAEGTVGAGRALLIEWENSGGTGRQGEPVSQVRDLRKCYHELEGMAKEIRNDLIGGKRSRS